MSSAFIGGDSSMPQLIYQGSVKRLYDWGQDTSGRGILEFQFSDAYSVFDYGTMPDLIPDKGQALASMARGFFRRLQNPANWQPLASALEKSQVSWAIINELTTQGLRTHWIEHPVLPPLSVAEKLSEKKNSLFTKKLSVHPPEKGVVAGESVYRYPQGLGAGRVLPLEVVFRFAAPTGSSLYGRLTPAVLARLGLDRPPTTEDRFSVPYVEFFTKLEPKDRFLDTERAMHYADLSLSRFQELCQRTVAVAIFIGHDFASRGLELLDGKLEWGLDHDGAIILVDSIGPDELRIVEPRSGAMLSKEFLRQYYRKTDWYQQFTSKAIQLDGTKRSENAGSPPPLPPHVLSTASDLYRVLAQVLEDEAPPHPVESTEKRRLQSWMDDLVKRINACRLS
jgi:phosphoribosylaminoimidazole-succinocarboxamide synthase